MTINHRKCMTYILLLIKETILWNTHICTRMCAITHNLEIIPTGEAVQRYRKELPVKYTEKSNNDVVGSADFKKLSKPAEWWPNGVEKETGLSWPSGDVFHFNWQGEYLQGLLWTAVLFDVDVTKCKYSPKYLKIDSPQAVLMKKIANELRKR